MSEKEIKFLEKLRAMFADAPFGPLEAMQEFRLSELPESVRGYLVIHGPGLGATKSMARFLAAAGATRTERTRTGYLWMLP
jgi:hypothetical protein